LRNSITFLLVCWVLVPGVAIGQSSSTAKVNQQKAAQKKKQEFSEQDRLRGSVTPQRKWWDLLHYDLSISVNPKSRSIKGKNVVRFSVLESAKQMQIDLQKPLEITSVKFGDQSLKYSRNGNVYLIDFEKAPAKGTTAEVVIYYGGKPKKSLNPPWSGGFSWRKDKSGKPFIATSCQGIGASIFWPCKDHGYDEPQQGADIRLTVPEGLVAVSNGRLQSTKKNEKDKTSTFHWKVTLPINNYSINVNIGDYVHFEDEIQGEGGKLDVQYWVLRENLDAAKKHFKEANLIGSSDIAKYVDSFDLRHSPVKQDEIRLTPLDLVDRNHRAVGCINVSETRLLQGKSGNCSYIGIIVDDENPCFF